VVKHCFGYNQSKPLSTRRCEASEHQPSEVGSFSYWFDKPWFHTEGRLATVLIIPSYWGSQLGGHLHAIKHFSGTVVGEKEDFCKGSLSLPIFYFVIVLLYFIFACIFLSKIQKKIVSFIVGTSLLLVYYVVP
jgi:hypothetical protein